LAGCARALHNLRRVHCAGNAQLRVLNSVVGRSYQDSDTQPVLPTQLVLFDGGTAGVMAAGVSSFGYSGTIAHVVLRSTIAGRAEALSVSPPPLMYRRCTFTWHEPRHPLTQRHLTSADDGRRFPSPAAGASALSATLALLAPLKRRAHVEASVLRIVHELGGSVSAEVDADTPLMEAGIDSLAGTELSSRLRALTDIALSSTLLFEQPTPRAVAEHLLERVQGDETAAPPLAVAIAATDSMLSSTPVVLAGAVGLLPGGCDVEAVQIELCRTCGDAIGQVPASRWTLSQAVDVAALSQLLTNLGLDDDAARQLIHELLTNLGLVDDAVGQLTHQLLTNLGLNDDAARQITHELLTNLGLGHEVMWHWKMDDAVEREAAQATLASDQIWF